MMNANKETMLRRLQAADFVLHETVLYLDGHPTNQKALEFFRRRPTPPTAAAPGNGCRAPGRGRTTCRTAEGGKRICGPMRKSCNTR